MIELACRFWEVVPEVQLALVLVESQLAGKIKAEKESLTFFHKLGN